MCYQAIAKSLENLKYRKPPNQGVAGSALGVFSMMGGVLQSQHI